MSSPTTPTTPHMNERPGRLAMEGFIYNGDKVLEVALNPDTKEVPTKLVEDCVGVVLLNVVHAGAIMTLHWGTGVVLAKKNDGTWSPPCSVFTMGYSLGAVLGGKVDQKLIFINNEETLKDFVKKPQTRLGLDASASVASVGGSANVGIDAENQGTTTLSYTNGAYAGLSVQLGTLEAATDQNKVFYNGVSNADAILMKEGGVSVPDGSQIPDLYKKLDLLKEGKTWLPSDEDISRSSRFLSAAQDASAHFSQRSVTKEKEEDSTKEEGAEKTA